MKSNRVHILSNGTWNANGPVIYRHPCGLVDPVAIAMNFFLIEADGKKILVDAGVDNLDQFIDEDLRASLGLHEKGSTLDELKRIGVAPEEVDILLLTHLHFDHSANIHLFPNARIILSETEWRFVTTPGNDLSLTRAAFPRGPIAFLIDEAWERLELFEKEIEVVPGVRAILTGGHSPGHSIVTVETGDGLVVLPGDEIAKLDNLEMRIPIGGYHNLENLCAAMDLIVGLGGIVLPVHEPLLADMYPEGVIPAGSN